MMEATYRPYTLEFKQPSGTSRGTLTTKLSWFIFLKNSDTPETVGVGECGVLAGLSADDRPGYEAQLAEVCRRIDELDYWLETGLREWPSIYFGLEMAVRDLNQQGQRILFSSDFTEREAPIPINGLIWMGEKSFMREQIKSKLAAGFRCIKLKIGAIDFEAEMDLLTYIRQQFPAEEVEIRVDANGAFLPERALEKLKRLAEMELHSIEQPIRPGQLEQMAALCEQTPLPIALDEELIGVYDIAEKRRLIDTIRPQYLIFKPSFIGGYKGTEEWIELCKTHNCGWWVTSALESNIGLNAIAQWTATLKNSLPQGLGTGQLYTNNFPSPLSVHAGYIYYRKNQSWDLSKLPSRRFPKSDA